MVAKMSKQRSNKRIHKKRYSKRLQHKTKLKKRITSKRRSLVTNNKIIRNKVKRRSIRRIKRGGDKKQLLIGGGGAGKFSFQKLAYYNYLLKNKRYDVKNIIQIIIFINKIGENIGSFSVLKNDVQDDFTPANFVSACYFEYKKIIPENLNEKDKQKLLSEEEYMKGEYMKYFTSNHYNKSLESKIPIQIFFNPNPFLLSIISPFSKKSFKINEINPNDFWLENKTNKFERNPPSKQNSRPSSP